MVGIFFGLIVLVAGFVAASTVFKDRTKRNGDKVSHASQRTLLRVISTILAILCVASSCVATVHTGYTGIVTKFNQVQDYTYEAGLHFKSPFVRVIEMDNREQRAQFQMEAFSADIQEVQVIGSINYSIDKTTAMRLYKEVGTSYDSVLIAPRAQEVLKATFAKYTAEGLIANRQQLSSEIYDALKADLEPQGINIISISIENIDFTDAFTNAVEAKQVATQEKQRAQTQQEQATMEAEQAAKRKKIEAEAAAEVAKVQADAEAYSTQVKAAAEAEANEKINKSLTEELVNYRQVQRWNGELPQFVGGGSTIPILNMGETTETTN